ncbi:hypothetical protein BDV96DRAFT_13838 [Lophiotrema nucula]|uniref:Uncharacterized protein n=1 Tax=Lophiotrema nucula TaxID=690887 RepID=A0A6A5ZXK0_9PLEO|nr:hypothetical protein BDV96DRAFT_13838 [Lophiotrema nucula]
MAPNHDSTPYTDDDPAAAASDALSLHTIADQADPYASQEQEDADFALALQLEEEDARNHVDSQRQSQSQPQVESGEEVEALPPYSDDPEAVTESFPPYRDDPNAPFTEDDHVDVEATATSATAAQKRIKSCFRILRQIGRIWACLGLVTFVVTITVIVVVFLVIWKFGKTDPKRAAWTASSSRDYDLKLPNLYPQLEQGANPECKQMWEKYAGSLSCHRVILSPSWDDGVTEEVEKEGTDPMRYSEAICKSRCRDSIRHFDNPMHNGCYRRTDRFDFTNYGKDGKQYFAKESLPEGPLDLVKMLLDRYDRFCAVPPKDTYLDRSEWGTCAADLWMRWGIVDGKDENSLSGLDRFLAATDERKTIEGGKREVDVEILYGGGKTKKLEVAVPTRQAGPGIGKTDCGYCTLDWLERKMRAFEYGQFLDPTTGEPLGLKEFENRVGTAIRRCGNKGSEGHAVGTAIGRVYRKWESFGWWCTAGSWQPCHPDNATTEEVRKILHGLREDDWPLTDISKQMKAKGAPRKALQALQAGMRSMPCSIWFSEDAAIKDIIPHQHIIGTLCSDRCLNSVDRIQQRYGDDFDAAASSLPTANIFQAWNLARVQVNQTCKASRWKTHCAPGYSALGHPEWIFTNTSELAKPLLLSTFSTAIDALEATLPRYPQKPKDDIESQRILARRVAESVCNGCGGELLIGQNPDWAIRVREFLDDSTVDSSDYARTAKKYFRTCTKMMGHRLSRQEEKNIWNTIGLGEFADD